MAILETFYLLFKADTKDLKKGTSEAQNESKKLESSFNATAVASRKMQTSVVALGGALAGLAAGFLSLGLITRSISAAIDYTQQLGEASRALNTNVSDLDAWGRAVQRTGGNAQQFQQSLRSLSEHLGTTPQGAMSVLPKLADAFERMGRVRSLQYGKMLGLDEHTIRLLQQGRRELDLNLKRQRELGVVTKEDTEIALQYNNAITDSQHAWNSLFVTLGLAILPTLTQVANGFASVAVYLREHKDLITGALIAIGSVAAAIAAPFIAANIGIVAVIAGIGTAIGLFAIAYEDIKAFMEGNESLTGDILKRWPVVGQVVGGVINAWRAGFQGILTVINAIRSAFSGIASFFGGGKTLEVAQSSLASVGSNPLNTQVGGLLGRSPGNRTNSLQTGDITINTQATDAEGIQDSFRRELMSHFWQSNSNFDDGVLA